METLAVEPPSVCPAWRHMDHFCLIISVSAANEILKMSEIQLFCLQFEMVLTKEIVDVEIPTDFEINELENEGTKFCH